MARPNGPRGNGGNLLESADDQALEMELRGDAEGQVPGGANKRGGGGGGVVGRGHIIRSGGGGDSVWWSGGMVDSKPSVEGSSLE